MVTTFKPAPDDTLELFGERLAFRQHPAARIRMPFSQEGGRATVYELRRPSGERLALKVFRPSFRDPALAESGTRLSRLQRLEGLQAAQRRVVLPGDAPVRRFPDLEYALLMPWIDGDTWSEVMIRAANDGVPLPVETALHLCERFLKVVRALEEAGCSHTDLAGGNVVVRLGPPAVQLLDLEDIYLPGAPFPSNPRPGSPGYQHSRREPVFCAEGDRYAAAVMAAEMLALTHAGLTELGGDSGMFGTHAGDPVGDEAYRRVEPWLRQVAPPFAAAFARAWHSARLAECPTVAELHGAVASVVAARPSATLSAPPEHTRVRWSNRPAPPPPAPARPQPPPRPPQPRPSSGGNVSWNGVGNAPTQGTQPSPPVPRPQPRPSGEIPTVLIVVLALILLALLAAVAACAPTPPGAAAAAPPSSYAVERAPPR